MENNIGAHKHIIINTTHQTVDSNFPFGQLKKWLMYSKTSLTNL